MQTISPDQLATHVSRLAGEIGEHNIYHPHALNAVADYIIHEWRQQGYTVTPYPYTVKGMECSNLEITRDGMHPNNGIILIGAPITSATANSYLP
ncbi:MAG TPA: hypothetical protein VIM41_15790 [Gammaproteobacteria bacterium]